MSYEGPSVFIKALLFFLLMSNTFATTTLDEGTKASKIVARWFSKITEHEDFQSATPVAVKRAGPKFMIVVAPDMQMASDYGFSYTQARRDEELTHAYETLGVDTKEMSTYVELNRVHANWGIGNLTDLSFSYLFTLDDSFSGWGLGYKRVLKQVGPFYFSYRIKYSRSDKEDYYFSESLTNDFSLSLYLRLIDFYVGARHTSGKVKFISSIPQLQYPTVKYVSNADQLEYFSGVSIATTTNTRLAFQAAKFGNSLMFSAKLSMHFDSIFPGGNGWFRDPRYIKQ